MSTAGPALAAVPGTLPDAAAEAFSRHFQAHIEQIEGWLPREEAELLYRCARAARGGHIVEIGAYRGRSTVALALGSLDGAGLQVFSVDPHAEFIGPGGGHYGPADREAFYRNVLASGTAKLCSLVGLRSAEAARAIDGPLSLIWIDGDHSTAAVMQDVRIWSPKLAVDGLLLLDDVSDAFEGPRLAVQTLERDGWTRAGSQVGKVVALRPPALRVAASRVAASSAGGVTVRPAAQLVTPSRLDIAAKHLHARLRAEADAPSWGRRIYLAHLQLWNGFFENVPRKTRAEDFISGFDAVLDATAASASEGLDTVVPVTLNGNLLNGSHRVCAALLYGRPVRTIAVEVQPEQARYDGAYFERLVQQRGHGGEPLLLLAMCLEFVRIVPACRVVTLFAHLKEHRQAVDALLAQHGSTVWTFERSYEGRDQLALVRLLYEGEAWLGNVADGFRGVGSKAGPCFAAGSTVRFVLLAPGEAADWVALKADLRSIGGVGKHSVHINDTTAETDRVLRVAADELAFALYARSWPRLLPAFAAQFAAFRTLVLQQGRAEDVVVTGSAAMAVFGLRDSADLDYLHRGPPLQIAGRDDIGSHNPYAAMYPVPIADMVLDPDHHVMVDGIRFLRPSVLCQFKRRRGEAKDLRDQAMLDAFAQKLQLVDGPDFTDPWTGRSVLWLLDGGNGRAAHIQRLLGLRDPASSGLQVLLGLEAARDPGLNAAGVAFLPDGMGLDGDADALADLLLRRPRARVLVVRDGLDNAAALLGLSATLPQGRLLVMTWQAIDGWRPSFVTGLAAFCGLPPDNAWETAALSQWDSLAEPPVPGF